MKIKTGYKKTFTTVLARSGGGKTMLCYFLLKAQKKPCLIVDNFEQFEDELTMSFEELVEAFNNEDFRNSFYKYKKTILVRLGNTSIDTFFTLIMKSKKFENLLIFVDEIDINLAKSTVKNADSFYEFLNRGRHKNLDFLSTCRNTANVPKVLIGQTDVFYFSDIIEKGTIAFIDETLHKLDVKDEIADLEKYEFLKVDINSKELSKLNTDIEWLKLF